MQNKSTVACSCRDNTNKTEIVSYMYLLCYSCIKKKRQQTLILGVAYKITFFKRTGILGGALAPPVTECEVIASAFFLFLLV